MPLTFRTSAGYTQGSYSQLIVSPMTNLIATSTVAGQITLTWSNAVGYNVKYSYALSSGTIQSISGQNPTTITLTSTNSIITAVTLTASVLGGSVSATSDSVTTLNPIKTLNTIYSALSGAPNITYNYNSQNCHVACDVTGQYIYVTQGSTSNFLYYSSNYGATFSSVTFPTLGLVWYSQITCSSTGQYVWVTANNGSAYYSQNGGTSSNPTFTIVSSPNVSGPYATAVSADGTKVCLCSSTINGAGYSTNGTSATPTFTASTGTMGSTVGNDAYMSQSASMQYIYFGQVNAAYVAYSLNYGQTFAAVATPTTPANSGQCVGCDLTGQYVAYTDYTNIYFNTAADSRTGSFTWTLLKTLSTALWKTLKLVVSGGYIVIIVAGSSASPFTGNIYGGIAPISTCTSASSWTWNIIASDQQYQGIAYASTGNIMYFVGQNAVLSGSLFIAPYTSYITSATTPSGAAPLIAYTFQSATYNKKGQQFVNVANNGVDNLYLFNYGTNVAYTTVGGYNAITFTNTGNTTGTFLNNSGTQYKASINYNPPANAAYVAAINAISSTTSYSGMTLSYWLYNNDTGSGIINLNEWNSLTGYNNRLYMEKYNGKFSMIVGGAGSPSSSSITFALNTWYHIAIEIPFAATVNGGIGYIYITAAGAASANLAASGAIAYTTTVGNNEFINTSVASNPQFVATLGCGFNDSGWNNGYMADYRLYGSMLSASDLTAILTAGPK
jgi:hypothetical protein